MSMSGLHAAVSGMRAAQTNLYVTGHNMANHSTRGFTRQMVHQAHFNSRTIGMSAMQGPMQIGLGTSMNGIRQVRDHFLDVRFRETVPRLAYWEVRTGAHMEMDAIFGELEGHYRLHVSLEQLNAALNELINDTPSRETRSNFVAQANTFIDRANAAQRATLEYQIQLDQDIRRSVQRVNQLLTDIHDLNQRIMRERAFGQNPNDFMDLRNNALDELATIIDITFIEVPGGSVNIMTAHGGQQLLMNGFINHLGLRQAAPMSSFVEPVFTSQDRVLEFHESAPALFNWNSLSRNYTMGNGGQMGSLLSMLSSRGLTHTNYRSHPVEEAIDIQNRVDMTGAISALMPVAVPPSLADFNTILTQWNDFLANADFGGFAPPNTNRTFQQVVMSSRFERPSDINAQIASELAAHAPGINPTSIEDARLSVAQALAIGDITAEEAAQMNIFLNSMESTRPGGNFAVEIMQDFDLVPMRRFDMNHGVIPQIQSQFDTLVNTMVNMFNDNLTQPFYVNGVNMGLPRNEHGYYHGQIVPPSTTPWDLRLFVQIREGEGYTLGNLRINPLYSLQGGGSHLPLAFEGESDNRLLLHMMNQWNSPIVQFNNWEPKSFNFFYRNMITEMGTGGAEALSHMRATVEEVEMVQHRRMSVSAVSLEEEMASMIRFQHAYNSSARMISMLDSMLETLINVGR